MTLIFIMIFINCVSNEITINHNEDQLMPEELNRFFNLDIALDFFGDELNFSDQFNPSKTY